MTAKPKRFTLEPGASVTVTFTADVRSATQGKFLFGEVGLTARGAAAQHLPVDVPAGSKFLAAAITETSANDLDLFVGRDTDGDRAADEGEEVCRSASEIALESCNVTKLEGGTYWVMVQNWLSGRVLDDVKLVVSTVPGTDAGNLTATGPKRAGAGSSFDVTLAWNEPAMAVDDTWFGLVDLG